MGDCIDVRLSPSCRAPSPLSSSPRDHFPSSSPRRQLEELRISARGDPGKYQSHSVFGAALLFAARLLARVPACDALGIVACRDPARGLPSGRAGMTGGEGGAERLDGSRPQLPLASGLDGFRHLTTAR